MKTCPGCGMVLANQCIRCPSCKHLFIASDPVGIAVSSGNLGKLNKPPQKVRISPEGELCWVPLNGHKEKTNLGIFNNSVELQEKQHTKQQSRSVNSPAAQLARERAEAAKAQIELRKAAEAAKAQIEMRKAAEARRNQENS